MCLAWRFDVVYCESQGGVRVYESRVRAELVTERRPRTRRYASIVINKLFLSLSWDGRRMSVPPCACHKAKRRVGVHYSLLSRACPEALLPDRALHFSQLLINSPPPGPLPRHEHGGCSAPQGGCLIFKTQRGNFFETIVARQVPKVATRALGHATSSLIMYI